MKKTILSGSAEAPPDKAPSDEVTPDHASPEGGSGDEGFGDEGSDDEGPDDGAHLDGEPSDSTPTIDQSSSVQVFADEGSSTEVEAVQVAAIGADDELDGESISDSSGQNEDGDPESGTHGELSAEDEGAGDDERATAEPNDNEDTSGEGYPAVPEEQGSAPAGQTPRPADGNVQSVPGRPPTETESTGTDPMTEEPGRKPQTTNDENQQAETPQNTDSQSGDPQAEPQGAQPAGGSPDQEAPNQEALNPSEPSGNQSDKHQSGPVRSQDDSGSRAPDHPRGDQPATRRDSMGRPQRANSSGGGQAGQKNIHRAGDAKPAPTSQQRQPKAVPPNLRESASPARGTRQKSKPQETLTNSAAGTPAGRDQQSIQGQVAGAQDQPTGRPSNNPGTQQFQQVQHEQQQGVQQVEEQATNVVEEQSFTEADPAAGEVEYADGIEYDPVAGKVEEADWTEQTAVPATQQAVRQERRAARQAARAERITARQAAAQEEAAAQNHVEPAVEPIAESSTEQSWEQPVQQADVDSYAEPSAAPDQTSVSEGTYESVEGSAREATGTYVGEGSSGTEVASDPNTYNNDPYVASQTSESYEDSVATPVGDIYAAPEAEETYTAQNTAGSDYSSGHAAYEETYQQASTQVPTQELEPAPQVTNILADKSSAVTSGGTSEATSPATNRGQLASTADTVVQNTTSTVKSGGRN